MFFEVVVSVVVKDVNQRECKNSHKTYQSVVFLPVLCQTETKRWFLEYQYCLTTQACIIRQGLTFFYYKKQGNVRCLCQSIGPKLCRQTYMKLESILMTKLMFTHSHEHSFYRIDLTPFPLFFYKAHFRKDASNF